VLQSIRMSALARLALGAAVIAAAMGGLVGSAAAQTITLSKVVTRTIADRPSNQFPLEISYSDCIAGDAYEFTVSTSNFSGFQLEVWGSSGTNCNDYAQRRGASPQCWPVLDGVTLTATSSTLTINSRDIIAQRKGGDIGAEPGTIDDCNKQTGTGLPSAFSLFFMFVNASGEIPAGSTPATYTSKWDLLGPPAPTEVSAGSGENELVVNFKAPTSGAPAGYRFYCDPPPAGRAVDAGAGTDAGDGDGGTAECGSGLLVSGAIPNNDLQCGSASGIATNKGEAKGLENSVVHAVAVAAYDGIGNVGPLSTIACGTPLPVTDFFEAYRGAGGKAGGGYCSIGATPWRGSVAIVVGAAAAWLIRRRRAR
jgi:hypothetical protein